MLSAVFHRTERDACIGHPGVQHLVGEQPQELLTRDVGFEESREVSLDRHAGDIPLAGQNHDGEEGIGLGEQPALRRNDPSRTVDDFRVSWSKGTLHVDSDLPSLDGEALRGLRNRTEDRSPNVILRRGNRDRRGIRSERRVPVPTGREVPERDGEPANGIRRADTEHPLGGRNMHMTRSGIRRVCGTAERRVRKDVGEVSHASLSGPHDHFRRILAGYDAGTIERLQTGDEAKEIRRSVLRVLRECYNEGAGAVAREANVHGERRMPGLGKHTNRVFGASTLRRLSDAAGKAVA